MKKVKVRMLYHHAFETGMGEVTPTLEGTENYDWSYDL